MPQETETGQSQFRLATLLSATACAGVFCALAIWVTKPNSIGGVTEIPLPILPSPSVIVVGVFAVPVGVLLLVLLMLILVFESRPRSFTAFIFVGLVLLAVCTSLGSLRLLVALSLVAVAMLIESLLRKLPKSQVAAAALSFLVCVGYYVYLASAALFKEL